VVVTHGFGCSLENEAVGGLFGMCSRPMGGEGEGVWGSNPNKMDSI